MIIDYLNKDYEAVISTIFVVFLTWIGVLVGMLIDLHFGILKAREIGECTTSEGYRRTIKKATYYYALMTFAGLLDFFDVVSPHFFSKPLRLIPFFSLFAMICLILTEIKSVREKAEDKYRRRVDKSFGELLEAIKSREDISAKILEHLQNEKKKQDEKNG